MRVSGSDLRLLQVFDAVVRGGGYAGAEAELNIGQSTISNHMTALEERIGFTLCQRGRGGFRLTERGRAVHEAARRLGGALGDFAGDIAALKGELRGELRVAILDSVASDPRNRLSEVVRAFGRIAPEVRLTLVQERPQDIQPKVAEGLYHCGIGSHRSRVEGIDYRTLYEESHGLYCGDAHPFFGRPDAELTDEALAEAPYVHRGYWREEDGMRRIRWRIEATVQQIEPELMLIRSGRYVGFLPHHAAEADVAAGRLRQIRPDDIGYLCLFELYTPRARRGSDVLSAFLASVDETWR
ncbi:LysR family transcriptional regulator [Aureimonas flava]|uniref:LysR family transcriptional regulator n=1 Tax=Aureimonas flava TaxID=2320271 RepID=A0A3A1WP42_9HYPH|nr:LysR family transcriptional regulator [Aureimonas flava]RIY02503.1 LysR family transcriptional regulator [Aureimonas flava]